MNTRHSLSFWQHGRSAFLQNTPALIGLFFLCALLLLALFAPLFTAHTYDATHLHMKNTPPCSQFWFGTDELGRDLFTRIFLGARVSLGIGFCVAFIDLVIGVLFGSFAALIGGKTEKALMRLTDILYSIPYLLVVILLMMLIGSGFLAILTALTFTGWIKMARVVRGQLLQVRELDFVKAAVALGAGKRRLLFYHLIPNCSGQILITLMLTIPSAIFAEAFLSFLGLGIQAPFASWGTMANDGLTALRVYPWRLFFPAGFICFTLLCFSFVTEGLRDAFDPKQRRW